MSAYRVAQDENGCSECGAGATWCVVGPDDVALGTSYGFQSDAEGLAEALNRAHDAARQAVYEEFNRRKGPADRRAPDGPRQRTENERRKPPFGRRRFDDDIPF